MDCGDKEKYRKQTVLENRILDTATEAFLRLDRAGRRRPELPAPTFRLCRLNEVAGATDASRA
jgi:hypothetical protein